MKNTNKERVSEAKIKLMRWSAVFLILTAHFAILVSLAGRKSVTSDEPFHIARGVSVLFNRDFSLSVAHPPLVNGICALPLLAFDDLQVPQLAETLQDPGIDPSDRKRWFSQLLLWVLVHPGWQGNPNPLKIIFWCRVPVMLMSVVLGLLIYAWSARLAGPGAGLASILLYCFSPTVLAHSALATTETGSALFIFIFAMALYRHLGRPSWPALLLCGLTFGLAQLSKFTSVLLAPLVPLVFVLAIEGNFTERLKRFISFRPGKPEFLTGVWAWIVIMLLGALVIWAGYGFETGSIYSVQVPDPEPLSRLGLFIRRLFIQVMAGLSIPPETYYFGLARTMVDTAEHAHPIYFLGRVSDQGWWYYYPVLFVIKEPLAFLTLLLMGILIFRKEHLLPKPANTIALVFSAGMVLFFMFLNQKNIGIRHLLPVYPFLFLWAGSVVRASFLKRAYLFAASVLLVVYLGNAFVSFPDYLVHFNSLVGGPDGGLRYSVVGEDWGQDVQALGEFCRERDVQKIYYNAYGNTSPKAYGVPAQQFECGRTDPGWYAVHVVDLRRPRKDWPENCFSVFMEMEPHIILQHTIYVYDLRGQKNKQ